MMTELLHGSQGVRAGWGADPGPSGGVVIRVGKVGAPRAEGLARLPQ